jgi:hypothetical protein
MIIKLTFRVWISFLILVHYIITIICLKRFCTNTFTANKLHICWLTFTLLLPWYVLANTIFTWWQDKAFSLNLTCKYVRLPSIHVRSVKPDCCEPDHALPNQDLHHQILICATREHSSNKLNWKFFFWHCLISYSSTFQKLALLLSSGKDTPNFTGPLDWPISLLGTTWMVHFLRYAADNRSSPREVKGKSLMWN